MNMRDVIIIINSCLSPIFLSWLVNKNNDNNANAIRNDATSSNPTISSNIFIYIGFDK